MKRLLLCLLACSGLACDDAPKPKEPARFECIYSQDGCIFIYRDTETGAEYLETRRKFNHGIGVGLCPLTKAEVPE